MTAIQSPVKKFQFITKVLKRFKVFPSSVGCLWVDEYAGLDEFTEMQSTWWSVDEKDQLAAMKEQYPTAKLYAHSLLSFRFPTSLQFIYALDKQFQTIGWTKNREKVLKKCFDHLEPYGVLLFNIDMPKAFDTLLEGQQVTLAEDEVLIHEQTQKKWLLVSTRISFVRNEQWTYDRHDETTKQQLLSITELKKLLKWFETIEFLDHNGRKANTKTKHVVVVVQKGR